MNVNKNGFEPQFGNFHELMKYRVREILIVSSLYDAFVLEEDGGLSERILSEFMGLNLQFIPRIHRVSTAEEALTAIKEKYFDLVITMTRLSDMNVNEFGRRVKELKPAMPVILLTYEWVEADLLAKLKKTKNIDKVFYWNGDTRMLLAIIKYIEDAHNVDNDIKQGIQVILVIEDSPRFFSLFLPIIYTEIMTQTRHLISEGVNDLHRQLRMRARPKILLAETYEEGMEIFEKYKNNLLGVISDLCFPREGKLDEEAGFRFARKVKEEITDLPFLIQSSSAELTEVAKQGLDFINKNSDNLLHELHQFILSNFGFGDFIFKDPADPCGGEIARAANLIEFERVVQYVRADSLLYHARKNHISIWLRARTEFEGAEKLRPVKVSDFEDVEALRIYIQQAFREIITRNQFGVIVDFGHTRFDSQNAFIKLGNGSLGGKARGIAFLNTLLTKTGLAEVFPEVEIRTPSTFVICSGVFEEFLRSNRLQEFSISENGNDMIAAKFMAAQLPDRIVMNLRTLLEKIQFPIAVRSSSLLEDSQSLPFAGLYSTYMLPNNHPDLEVRLKQLCDAVKLVFASVFYKSPKEYVKNTSFRTEEEKMAVIIQQIVGQVYNERVYPVVSGVAQSYNYYPFSHMDPEDGVVEMALGLGVTITDGGRTYRFSPRYPEMPPPFSSAADFLKKSQSHFYALDLSNKEIKISRDEKFSLVKLPLAEAEADGTHYFVASTFSGADNVIRDTIAIEGPRVITFAGLLKYKIVPLPEILNEILKIGRESFGCHVEIEFALNLYNDKKEKPEFYLLQIRPIVTSRESAEISMEDIEPADALCMTVHSMGNGVFKDLYDLVYVDPETFDLGKTRLIAQEVGELNKSFIAENKNYILIGFGRWGTSDPWLGIPVEWYQICKARLVVEANLGNFKVDPSLGSHFFHNLTSLGLGYFHIANTNSTEFILWDWLKAQPVYRETKYVKHLRFSKPLQVKIDARGSRGAILKPNH
ncbi:MAG TPA: PEP/pyruvate-binding domain-containing protein [Candidatus Deferrimicrobium sp.]|nr:PEP/pyruvate-binding domain-containing protein [Candidatus Deferrimicrobium sp.]